MAIQYYLGNKAFHHVIIFYYLIFNLSSLFGEAWFLEVLVQDIVLVTFPVAVIQQPGTDNITDKRFVLDHSWRLEYTIVEELGLQELEAAHGVQNPNPVKRAAHLGLPTLINLIKCLIDRLEAT